MILRVTVTDDALWYRQIGDDGVTVLQAQSLHYPTVLESGILSEAIYYMNIYAPDYVQFEAQISVSAGLRAGYALGIVACEARRRMLPVAPPAFG